MSVFIGLIAARLLAGRGPTHEAVIGKGGPGSRFDDIICGIRRHADGLPICFCWRHEDRGWGPRGSWGGERRGRQERGPKGLGNGSPELWMVRERCTGRARVPVRRRGVSMGCRRERAPGRARDGIVRSALLFGRPVRAGGHGSGDADRGTYRRAVATLGRLLFGSVDHDEYGRRGDTPARVRSGRALWNARPRGGRGSRASRHELCGRVPPA